MLGCTGSPGGLSEMRSAYVPSSAQCLSVASNRLSKSFPPRANDASAVVQRATRSIIASRSFDA